MTAREKCSACGARNPTRDHRCALEDMAEAAVKAMTTGKKTSKLVTAEIVNALMQGKTTATGKKTSEQADKFAEGLWPAWARWIFAPRAARVMRQEFSRWGNRDILLHVVLPMIGGSVLLALFRSLHWVSFLLLALAVIGAAILWETRRE